MADRTENPGRRCAAGLTAAVLMAAAAAGTTGAAAAADGPAAPPAGEVNAPDVLHAADAPVAARPGVPASTVFAPGAPPALAAALVPVPAGADSGERAGAGAGEAGEEAEASSVSVPQRVLTVVSIFTAALLVLATCVAAFVVWNRIRLALHRRRAGGGDTV